MIDLTKPWPLGPDPIGWTYLAAGFVVILCVLLQIDHQVSVLATSLPPETVRFFNWVTRWGESDWILIPSAALLVISAVLAWVGRRRIAKLALIEMTEIHALIFVGVGLPSLGSNLLKRLVGRARPHLFDTLGLLDFHPFVNGDVYQSFPSGHTTTAFSAAMVLGFLAPRWFWLGLLCAVAIGASRIVVGAHYPTDVFGGIVLGTLGAYWVRTFFAAHRWGFESRPDGHIVQRRPAATLRLIRGVNPKRPSSDRVLPQDRP